MITIALVNPEIPPNTGTIARLCGATSSTLHIVGKPNFDMSDKAVKRAGLDYWHLLDVREHASWDAFLEAEHPKTIWLLTTKTQKPIWDAAFTRGDYLLFGNEQHGVPQKVHDFVGKQACLTLPMVGEARSLNLATAVCACVYEGIRQTSLS